jgi:putative membrane protein
MSPEANALFEQWSPPILIDLVMLAFVLIYLRGWLALRRNSSGLFPRSRLAAFESGMFCLWIAIGSPLSAFDEASLTVHMIQHIFLMLIVPPLILLGLPALPLMHGLPQWLMRTTLGPLLRWPLLQSLGKFLTHPIVCWVSATAALILWHIPAAFELALHSDAWHEVEHMCFLSTSILFWWPVVQPFPSEARWPRWSVPLYLFLGMLPSGVLGAFLVFCDRVVYPSYSESPSIFAATPLADQVFAGMLMWVLGFFVCAIPAVFITINLLAPAGLAVAGAPAGSPANLRANRAR